MLDSSISGRRTHFPDPKSELENFDISEYHSFTQSDQR